MKKGWPNQLVGDDRGREGLAATGHCRKAGFVSPIRQIGSSDSDTALATTLDENFFGKMDTGEPSADRRKSYVIKGWIDADGDLRERIFDVAASDGRTVGSGGRATTAAGNTVDEDNATGTKTIGDVELRAVWIDPDFDPWRPAVYYARFPEIPTPTRQAYDAKRGADVCPWKGTRRSRINAASALA